MLLREVLAQALHQAGVLAEADPEPLARIREHNPLLFDFVLKHRQF